ncbi:MAG: c-type cytochrome [Elusimicrobia bacterium]|nr:c-type cytochrome [Elusimicrobiota bacterium]
MKPAILAAALFAAAAVRAAEAPSEFQRNAALFQSKCSKCHTVGKGDRVGPDLKGVTVRRTNEWLTSFIAKPGALLDSDPEAKKLLERFSGVRMPDAGLSPAQTAGLVAYLEAVSAGPSGPEEDAGLAEDPPEAKVRLPDEGRRVWWPGAAGALVLLAAALAAWRLAGAGPAAMLALLAAGAGYWSLGGRAYHRLLGDQRGYAPAQPIAFSHKKHAGELGIACLNCHHAAERSDVAGVPSLEVCMSCHGVVKKAAGAQGPSPEIAKLTAAWESRGAVAWNRVHSLPRYAHFSHRAHVADGIRCQECHGPVETMQTLRQAGSLSMGWCINCHRRPPAEAPSHWKRSGGPLDCAACHW